MAKLDWCPVIGSMQVAKPLRSISFNYAGFSRYLLLKSQTIQYVYITANHLYVYYDISVDVGDIPSCLVVGSGFYSVSSNWASFALYFRYCEPIFGNGLRFYIDHERNKREHVGLIKC